MKMGDKFELPVSVETDVNECGCLEDKNTRHITTFAQHEIEIDDSIETLEYAAHAINNHDRLAEENAKLREALGSLIYESEPVFATERNTASVRSGTELGGYVKHYKAASHKINSAKQLLNQLKDKTNDK